MKTTYAYDPFGNTSVTGEASDNPFQYTGRENDQPVLSGVEGGLYYYRARYYSPELHRFISEDPILRPMNLSCSGLGISAELQWLVPSLIRDSKSFNSYLYVGNNPANSKDPTGLISTNCKCNFVICLALAPPLYVCFARVTCKVKCIEVPGLEYIGLYYIDGCGWRCTFPCNNFPPPTA